MATVPQLDPQRISDLPPNAGARICPAFHAAIELIGRRWNGVILQQLLEGPLRFHELAHAIPRITDAMLNQRLKDLEAAGIVERLVAAGRPVQVRYQLTDIGDRLAPILEAVASWGAEWSAQAQASPDAGGPPT